MKSRFLVMFCVLTALLSGYFVGRFQSGTAWDQLFTRYVYQRGSTEARQHVRILTYLRDGRQKEALLTLETLLDGSLITFVAYDRVPQKEREDFVFRAVLAAREYRTKYPWHGTSALV